MQPDEFIKFLKAREDFVFEFSSKWQSLGFTALISPVVPHCAFRLETARSKSSHVEAMGEYNYLWSITGFPAGVLPITRVWPDEQTFTDTYNDAWTESLHSDAQGTVNMPVCLQVIGHAFEDEQVLAIMKVLGAQAKFEE